MAVGEKNSSLLRLLLLVMTSWLLTSCERHDLDEELDEKKTRLNQLAHYSLRSEVGAIGYRSIGKRKKEAEWVQVNLQTPRIIDQVVLVPCIRRDTQNGLQADGFPEAFEVQVGLENGSVMKINRTNEKDHFLPRIAPYIIKLDQPVKAKWVKVEAQKLNKIGWNNEHYFALSELMLFSGDRNIALHQSVSATSKRRYTNIPNSRATRYLVDGHLPYGMDSPEGQQSISFISRKNVDESHVYTVDLEQLVTVDLLKLHRIELDDTIPQSEPGDYAVPSKITVIGSLKDDFSDSIILHESKAIQSMYEIGPIMHYNLKRQKIRYLKLQFESNCIDPDINNALTLVGFSEIEVFSGSDNIAFGKHFKTNTKTIQTRKVEALTDGQNYYGKIVPEKQWISELAQRHELEREIPIIEE